jgi:hypothetical protein
VFQPIGGVKAKVEPKIIPGNKKIKKIDILITITLQKII